MGHREKKKLRDEKCDLETENERLTDHNKYLQKDMKILQERMAAVHADAKADPGVVSLCAEMRGLRFENDSLQQFVVRLHASLDTVDQAPRLET